MSLAQRGKLIGAALLANFTFLGHAATNANAQSRPTVTVKPPVAKLEADIPVLMKQADVPGMSMALIQNGRVAWRGNFGVKNTKSAELVDDNTVFEAASLSK